MENAFEARHKQESLPITSSSSNTVHLTSPALNLVPGPYVEAGRGCCLQAGLSTEHLTRHSVGLERQTST